MRGAGVPIMWPRAEAGSPGMTGLQLRGFKEGANQRPPPEFRLGVVAAMSDRAGERRLRRPMRQRLVHPPAAQHRLGLARAPWLDGNAAKSDSRFAY